MQARLDLTTVSPDVLKPMLELEASIRRSGLEPSLMHLAAVPAPRSAELCRGTGDGRPRNISGASALLAGACVPPAWRGISARGGGDSAMRMLLAAAALVGLAGCASDPAAGVAGSARAAAEGPPPTFAIDGLATRYFRCDGGKAFVVQNYLDGRVRVKTTDVGYDLERDGDGYRGEGVTYRREDARATLTGAAGGPYVNCAQETPPG